MPLVRGLRLLNSLESGNISGTCLETLMTCPARQNDFISILQSPGFACLAASSNASTYAVTRSNTALNTLGQSTIGACIYYSTPAFANNFAYSGNAFNNFLTSNDTLKHFANSDLTMSCAFATGTSFIQCVVASNTNLSRMFVCPITTCCIFRNPSAMASLANNSNIVAYLFSDPTASACFTTYGGATAICNAFAGTAYVNYILQPGVTCSIFADPCIGPYAFTQASSANSFIRNVCAYTALVNLPACCALGTSCTFTCFANSTYGIPCATTEYISGNTGFINEVFNLNSCAQLGALTTCNASFIRCYYRATTPFNDKFSCFWNTASSGAASAFSSFDLNSISVDSLGIRTPCLESFLTPAESIYYACVWCQYKDSVSSSNNGNFILVGGGYTVPGNVPLYSSGGTPLCLCIETANYCTAVHDTVKTNGFCVCCPGMMYSNNDGCIFYRVPGFCIPNTFFTCVCCDGFLYNACTAGQCGKVEIQWALGGFTCEGSIWQGFRINNLCCKSHGVWGYACATVQANNTPGAWTVCLGSFPFYFTTFCCGYFSGIGGDCVTTNFTGAGLFNAGYSNGPGNCYYRGAHIPRFVIGKMTGSANTCAFCLVGANSRCNCNPFTQVLRGVCVDACFACCCALNNPFWCIMSCFQDRVNLCSKMPVISFMTCVYGCPNNIRAWMLQLHDLCYTACGTYVYNVTQCQPFDVVGYHAHCNLIEWNNGSPRNCNLSHADNTILTIGAVIPLANTVLYVSSWTAYCVCIEPGTPTYFCYHCSPMLCMLRAQCSNFTWGNCTTCSPDAYCTFLSVTCGRAYNMFNSARYTPACSYFDCYSSTTYNNTSLPLFGAGYLPASYGPCYFMSYEGSCITGCCLDQGYSVILNANNNTFVATLMHHYCQYSSSGSFAPQILYNYPTDGSNANTIYGRADCAGAVAAACTCYCCLNSCGPRNFCNILLTGLCSPRLAVTSPTFGMTCCANFLRDRIPGCPMPAFCNSFYTLCARSDAIAIAGWPCAVVYGGNYGAPWGANTSAGTTITCTDFYCYNSVGCLLCLGANPASPSSADDFGRCSFRGGSYGWTCKVLCNPRLFSFCTLGTSHTISPLAPRFVCTANSMPSIAFGHLLCGSGFYANGATYTTCTFKLRFIDMF